MKILALDDNQSDLILLTESLISMGFSDISQTSNIDQALLLMQNLSFDIIISDYMLTGGRTAAELLQSSNLSSDTKFIVLTNYFESKVQEELSKLKPCLFIKKGFDDLELKQALDFSNNVFFKTPSTKKDINSKFFIKNGDNFLSIELSDINYFEVDGKYVKINCRDKTYVMRTTLRNLESRIHKMFIQVHSAYLVNASQIESFRTSTGQIYLKDGQSIPFSRNYKSNLIDNIVVA